jgi:hypothetical protein
VLVYSHELYISGRATVIQNSHLTLSSEWLFLCAGQGIASLQEIIRMSGPAIHRRDDSLSR